MSFGNYDNYGNNDNPWSGFNSDDYMQNIGQMSGGEGGNISENFWSSLQGDYKNAVTQWKETRRANREYFDKTQNFGQSVSDFWDDYSEKRTESNEAAREATEAFDIRIGKAGEEYSRKVEDYTTRMSNVLEEGTEKASALSQASINKYTEIEANLKDYSTQALQGAIQGQTRKMKSTVNNRIEQARRDGAPASVLSQIRAEGNQALREELQTGISNAAAGWQSLLFQAGAETAKSMQAGANTESQLAGLNLQGETQMMQAQMKGLNFASQMDMTGAEAVKNTEVAIATAEAQQNKEKMISLIEAEKIEMMGYRSLAEDIRNNPAIAQSTVWSTLLATVSMPNYFNSNRVGVSDYMTPGTDWNPYSEEYRGRYNQDDERGYAENLYGPGVNN